MANKDERPGLLSKVALFVRNPTKDWSELDQLGQPQEPGYDKQALKAMIERKRQNDFVRKREFDQLRKLRNRDPGAIANMARPSFFQTSLPTDPDGRAITLKKIDEIEAQMSKQWWKGKQDATQPHDLTTVPSPAEGESGLSASQLPGQSISGSSEPFEPTEAIALKGDGSSQPNEFAATQMASGAVPMDMSSARGRHESNAAAAGFGAGDVGFSTSRLFAIESDEMATDPELEEAAIRFANGDDAGAEKGLLAALRGPQLQPEAVQSWVAALLDFYRATAKRPAFEAAAHEFALALDGARPVWSNLADWVGVVPVDMLAESSAAWAAVGNVTWTCPAILNLAGMESLRDAMSLQPMPWHINWSALDNIAPDAMPLLDGLFSSLCDEPVQLQFSGSDRMVRALRAITASGDRSIDTVWWQTRLNALRAMQLQDDFELAALDYCITYEVSPPAWVDAHCQFTEVSANGDAPAFAEAVNTVPSPSDASPRLQGEVLGDASKLLAELDTHDVPGSKLVIDCGGLLRVDFAAAGSILNWVAMRQAQGKFVQFHNAHRLVAAFFNVIGINEHAKVIPRPI